MKKSFLAGVTFLMISFPVFASEDSERLIADALVSRQVQEQLSEFSRLVNGVSKVKVDVFNDLDVITLQGNIIREGDIMCGIATLQIRRTFQNSWAEMGPQAIYKAEVTAQDHCKPLK